MTRRLALIEARAPDAGGEALRTLARALVPYLRDLLGAERRDEELVDVAAVVPLSRRTLYAACRRGGIAGAVKRGRRWLATRGAVEAWLRAAGPRGVSSPAREGADGDDLEDLRRALARGTKRRAG